MTTKHTPGPWKAHKPAQSESSENAANARLIAAAPDLLDCAKRLDRAIGFFVAALTADHPVAKDLLGLREVARAAIAKAEGTT